MELSKKIDELGKDRFIYTAPRSRVIALYDHYFYSRNDYDHLSPEQRRYITEKFLKIQFKQKSGSLFEYEDKEIGILKSPGLGISPLDNLLAALNKYDYVVGTPLSCFLYYLYNKSSGTEIFRLLKKCPVNLDQAYDFSYQQEYQARLVKNFVQYKEFQAEHEASHKFKRL